APRLERRQLEAQLQHQRQEERNGPDTDAEQASTHDAGTKGRDLQEIEIEDWIGAPACVQDIERSQHQADRNEYRRAMGRQYIAAKDRCAKDQCRETKARQEEAKCIEGRHTLLARSEERRVGKEC